MMKQSAVCHCCHGTGREPASLDPSVVPLIAATVGNVEFTTGEILKRAQIVGGDLAEAFAGFSSQALGIGLGTLCGLLIDGLRLQRLGTDRGRVAVWKVDLPD